MFIAINVMAENLDIPIISKRGADVDVIVVLLTIASVYVVYLIRFHLALQQENALNMHYYFASECIGVIDGLFYVLQPTVESLMTLIVIRLVVDIVKVNNTVNIFRCTLLLMTFSLIMSYARKRARDVYILQRPVSRG